MWRGGRLSETGASDSRGLYRDLCAALKMVKPVQPVKRGLHPRLHTVHTMLSKPAKDTGDTGEALVMETGNAGWEMSRSRLKGPRGVEKGSEEGRKAGRWRDIEE